MPSKFHLLFNCQRPNIRPLALCLGMLRLMFFLVVGPSLMAAQPVRWIVHSATSLAIHGRTNVNTFTCEAKGCTAADTLYFTRSTEVPTQELVHGSIRINARLFDCGNGLMTSDFKRTLRVKEYPELTITIKNIRTADALADLPMRAWAELVVTVAGRSKQALVSCTFGQNGQHKQRLQGLHRFRFEDFGLTPPSRLLGAIKVEDNLDVAFDVHLVER